MKRIILFFSGIIGLLILIIVLQEIGFRSGADVDQTGGSGLMVSEALAAKQELKAGMIDPKTGKKIK